MNGYQRCRQDKLVEQVIEEPQALDIPKEAEEEFEFLDLEHKKSMLEIIGKHGYKPGYAENTKEAMDYCKQNNREFKIDKYTEHHYTDYVKGLDYYSQLAN